MIGNDGLIAVHMRNMCLGENTTEAGTLPRSSATTCGQRPGTSSSKTAVELFSRVAVVLERVSAGAV